MRILDVHTSPLRSCFLPLPLHVSCRRPWNLDGGKRFIHPELEVDCVSIFISRTFLVCCVWRSTCPHNFSLFVLKAHFSSHSPSWFSMQLQGNERRDLTGHMRHHGLEWAASALWDFSWRLLTFSLLRVVEIFHLGCLVVICLPDCNAQPGLWTAVLCFTITQLNHTRHTKVAWLIKTREQYKDKKTMKDDAF